MTGDKYRGPGDVGQFAINHLQLSRLDILTMSFPYKNVVIIGATSGIGLALAERMIENGVFVISVGRRQERLDEFAAKHGTKAIASQFDITNLGGIEAWVKG